MEVTTSTDADVVILAIRGRVSSMTAPLLGERLAGAFATPQTRLTVDMSGVDYMSSAGLRVLHLSANQAAKNSGRLVLFGLTKWVNEVFVISGFDSILTVCATREDALARIRA